MPHHGDARAVSSAAEQDSLHILPLSTIPLQTGTLRKSRLIKNSELQGMIEIFNDGSAGSGQIPPQNLASVFDMSGDRRGDLDIVGALGGLPSYDVYSLRISLRKLGIEVDEQKSLQLSPEKAKELADYMRVFTGPLMMAVYGNERSDDATFGDIVKLFASPDVETARQNLRNLAKTLNLNIAQIPVFLQDYSDVYLSLAYYQHCLDLISPSLIDLLKSIDELKKDPGLRSNAAFMKSCTKIEAHLKRLYSEVRNVLELFRTQTKDMWQGLSEERFRAIERVIHDYQLAIGGALCAVTVKIDAWEREFPTPSAGGPSKRADFIVRTMHKGLDHIDPIAIPAS